MSDNQPTLHARPERIADNAWAIVERIHAEHCRAAGPALDMGTVLRAVTQAGRVRFLSGGASSVLIPCTRIDAHIHAAEHGYRLCARRDTSYTRNHCWLPEDHDGDCAFGHGWHWELAYGQSWDGVKVRCTACQSETCEHVPASQQSLADATR